MAELAAAETAAPSLIIANTHAGTAPLLLFQPVLWLEVALHAAPFFAVTNVSREGCANTHVHTPTPRPRLVRPRAPARANNAGTTPHGACAGVWGEAVGHDERCAG